MATAAELVDQARDMQYAVVGTTDDTFWTDANLKMYLNDAQRDTMARLPDDLMPKLDKSQSGTPGAAGTALLTDFIKPLRCNVTVGGATRQCRGPVSPREGALRANLTFTGLGDYKALYWIEENKIYVTPFTGTAFVFKYQGIPTAIATDASSDGATFNLPENIQDAWPFYMAARASLKSREDFTVFWDAYMNKLAAFARKYGRTLREAEDPLTLYLRAPAAAPAAGG